LLATKRLTLGPPFSFQARRSVVEALCNSSQAASACEQRNCSIPYTMTLRASFCRLVNVKAKSAYFFAPLKSPRETSKSPTVARTGAVASAVVYHAPIFTSVLNLVGRFFNLPFFKLPFLLPYRLRCEHAAKRVKELLPVSYENAGGNGQSKSNTIWYIATRPIIQNPVEMEQSDIRGHEELRLALSFEFSNGQRIGRVQDEKMTI
jgi:hypothetical protein